MGNMMMMNIEPGRSCCWGVRQPLKQQSSDWCRLLAGNLQEALPLGFWPRVLLGDAAASEAAGDCVVQQTCCSSGVSGATVLVECVVQQWRVRCSKRAARQCNVGRSSCCRSGVSAAQDLWRLVCAVWHAQHASHWHSHGGAATRF